MTLNTTLTAAADTLYRDPQWVAVGVVINTIIVILVVGFVIAAFIPACTQYRERPAKRTAKASRPVKSSSRSRIVTASR